MKPRNKEFNQPICYLDRDGIINRNLPYVGEKERFFFHQEIFDILNFLRAKSYIFVLVTNQSGISRKYYTMTQFLELT